MTEQNLAELLKRIIVLMYGSNANGSPFWLFAAVKPAKYQAFQESYKGGTLDVHEFEPYGEILVCGEGKGPPDDVTLKVAEMYQTDSATLMASLVDESSSDKK